MKLRYQEIGRAELKVDCYAGETCDQHRPVWHGFFEGDRGDGEIGDTINLGVEQFRPGTKVSILEPVCPQCDKGRELCESDGDCLFDWKEWDEGQYA